MGSMIVYNSDEACILYIKKRNYIYLAIEGYLDSEKIKVFSQELLGICTEKKISKILFDTSKLRIVKEVDLEWLFNDIFSVLRSLNIKRIALLNPQNAFGYITIKRITGEIKKSKVKILDTMEEAEGWLFQHDYG